MRERVRLLAGMLISSTLGRFVRSFKTSGSTSMQMTWFPRSLRSSLPDTLTKTSPEASPVSGSTSPASVAAHFLKSFGKMTSVPSPSMSSRVTMAMGSPFLVVFF